jgi:hypothetical protein
MDLILQRIILWPKGVDLPPREVTFNVGKVNVITGQTQTGKSALIPIIDYCLGAEKCAIPVGYIRRTVQWFGVLFQLGDDAILLARRNPETATQSPEMYLQRGQSVNIPDIINSNIGVAAVKELLNQLAGLTSLGFTGAEQESGFDTRPSFRDLSAFEFQPQHIVANPYTLFFKADTFEHKKRLENILPLVLGAIDNETLGLKRRLGDLQRRIDEKEQQLTLRQQAAQAWLGELRGYYARARELGLIPQAPDPHESWNNESYLSHLRTVPASLAEAPLPRIERGATARLVRELNAISSEEDRIDRELTRGRRKLANIEKLTASAVAYDGSLEVQRSRLESVGWFSRSLNTDACPLCGAENDSAVVEVQKLSAFANAVEATAETITEARLVLDREAANLRREIGILEDRLQASRDHRGLLEARSTELKEQRQTLAAVYEFVGQLKTALSNVAAGGDDGTLGRELRQLRRDAESIRSQLAQKDERARLDSALARLSNITAHYARLIGVEYPEDPVTLDVKNLTLFRRGSDGRADYLWEIGSASNWLGYHIATLLGLHELFLSQTDSPVPRFLVIDQPSQVYFPDKWPGDPDPRHGNVVVPDTPQSDDIARVHQIFNTLAEAIRRTRGALQIVVIDHADERTWAGIPEVHMVERWRGDGPRDALIPRDWPIG